ncbi:MAG: DUF3135 domain-containing protein [Thermodesulfobacteriota bacterium]
MEHAEDFDFEEWSSLAVADPEAFEAKRQLAIEKVISSGAPEYRHRLRQLQWKVDAIRTASPNPMAACIRIYDLFSQHTFGPGGFLEILQQVSGGAWEHMGERPVRPLAAVLPLAPCRN